MDATQKKRSRAKKARSTKHVLGWALYISDDTQSMTRTWFKSLEDAKESAKQLVRKVKWKEWDEGEERYEGNGANSRYGFTIYQERKEKDDQPGVAKPFPSDEAQASKAKKLASTPSTPTTPNVVGVEGVEGKPEYPWEMGAGLDFNFRALGRVLAEAMPQLYQYQDKGLLLVEDARPKRILSAKELSPVIIDNVRMSVWKGGNYHAEMPSDCILNKMLASKSFLKTFRRVEEVVTTPVVLSDFTPSKSGYNEQGGILYLGQAVQTGKGMATINKFLDVMEFDGNASRTNAVAAALTVLFRQHWPGGKPLVLITANKSQSGKGTLMNFIRGSCPKVDIRYQNKDWPLEQSLQRQLQKRPEAGVITFDNVRLGSAGGGREINTALFESIITDTELVLSAASVKQVLSQANKYVVLLNTNEGLLSIDLLNRSLTSHLVPTGDLEERLERMKKELGGLDVKLEWLPANQSKIDAELWGMSDRWVKAGKPLDETVQYQMAPWAKTIGGILMVSGFTDFLGNFKATRSAVNSIRQAIADLAFYASCESKRRFDGKPLPTTELAKLVTDFGLHKDLGIDGSNAAQCAKNLGEKLTAHIGETFTAQTASEKIRYKLSKKVTHWNGKKSPVQRRYIFEEISRQASEDQGGHVLEEPSANSDTFPKVETNDLNDLLDDPKWKNFQGEKL